MDISRPTKSLWMDTALTEFHEVTENLSCDVAIIGAGIAGLLTAYKLLKTGQSVIVVDDGIVGGGETERTTAHITAILDSRYFELEHLHGTDKARKIAESYQSAVEWLNTIVQEENIDCQFKRVEGFLFIDPCNDADKWKEKEEELEKELAALARVGIDGALLEKTLPAWGQSITCIKVQAQAQFHVLKFLSGLIQVIGNMGGKIFSHCHINQIIDGEKVILQTNNGRTLEAKNVVVATNSPISNWLAIHSKLSAYRSYVIAAQGAQINDEQSQASALYWDTEDPYHYVRCHKIADKNYFIIGGEDHRTGQDNDYEERFESLELWARKLIPTLGPTEFRWSGQVYEPVDGIPYIGHDPGHGKNVFVATGLGGVGMSGGALAALLLGDLISGRENPLEEIYAPGRITLGAAGDYLKDNISTASQYLDHLHTSAADLNSIAPGEGAVISKGLSKIAVYRAETGAAFSCSAICPHMKAVVQWNSLEKSWDCPAHGSRFDSCGAVLDGPANSDLPASEIAPDNEQLPLLTNQITALEA